MASGDQNALKHVLEAPLHHVITMDIATAQPEHAVVIQDGEVIAAVGSVQQAGLALIAQYLL